MIEKSDDSMGQKIYIFKKAAWGGGGASVPVRQGLILKVRIQIRAN